MSFLSLPSRCLPHVTASKNVIFTSTHLLSTSQMSYNKKPRKKSLKEEFNTKTQKFRSLFVPEEDTHKRPSDLEIRKKVNENNENCKLQIILALSVLKIFLPVAIRPK